MILSLKEYTGPAADRDPNQPSTFQIPIKTILTAQRQLWQYGQRAFHDSIGSLNLLQDFRRWEDRLYCNELLKSSFVYNPGNFADGDTVDLSLEDRLGRPPKFTVKDIDQIVADMTDRNSPTFEDGNYCGVCSPYFLRDLRRDKEFLEISRYPGQIPVEAMTAPTTGMAPPQIPMVAGPWVAGLMGAQARDVNLQQTMPVGFVFNGVRWFVSNNLPKAQVPIDYTNAENPALNGLQVRTGELGIIFGPEAIGLGMGGPGPQILLNNNDDFGRFVVAIWQMYGAWELLDERFITVARSYS